MVDYMQKLSENPAELPPPPPKGAGENEVALKRIYPQIGFGKLETYEKLEKLGEGTYATVFRGRSLLTCRWMAAWRHWVLTVSSGARKAAGNPPRSHSC